MNERIQELIQAATRVIEPNDPDYRLEIFDKQLFAEMLIRECLEQVRDEVQYEHDWKLADAVSTRLLEHFGVEE